jgi:hypothetical protein
MSISGWHPGAKLKMWGLPQSALHKKVIPVNARVHGTCLSWRVYQNVLLSGENGYRLILRVLVGLPLDLAYWRRLNH